jgi:hypothetical protein
MNYEDDPEFNKYLDSLAIIKDAEVEIAGIFSESPSSLSEKSGSPNKIYVVNFGHDKKIQNPKLRKNA